MVCIVIDETYLIWYWKTFWKKYAELGTLKHYFLKVPIIALFATFAPKVLSYIRKSLYLHTLTRLYKQPLDYPNITQMIKSITKSGFKNLDFLISKARSIFKTIMAFVDEIDNVIALATYFWNLLLSKQQNQKEVLIRIYHSNLKTSTWSTFLEDFWIKKTQIWICINAEDIGVYIPNIT